jgi:hypothetical protein
MKKLRPSIYLIQQIKWAEHEAFKDDTHFTKSVKGKKWPARVWNQIWVYNAVIGSYS